MLSIIETYFFFLYNKIFCFAACITFKKWTYTTFQINGPSTIHDKSSKTVRFQHERRQSLPNVPWNMKIRVRFPHTNLVMSEVRSSAYLCALLRNTAEDKGRIRRDVLAQSIQRHRISGRISSIDVYLSTARVIGYSSVYPIAGTRLEVSCMHNQAAFS